jgi:site-specific DNA-methyltransferase (adenine-specific)
VQPYYADESVMLYGGDALAVLGELPTASVDAVITDPPYSSGGMLRGDRMVPAEQKYRGWSQNPDGSSRQPTVSYEGFTGDTRDQRGYLYWFALWAGECLRIAKPGAHFLTFTDWRQLPTTTDAVQSAGWVWRGLAVWDKGIGRPMRGRFRNHVEYIVWATNGPVAEEDVYLDSVFRIGPPLPDSRIHLTEKPVRLLQAFMPLVSKGATILDPFMGSGTTGVAAVGMERRFIGAELVDHYQRIAEHRIRDAQGQPLARGDQAALDFEEVSGGFLVVAEER